MLGGGRLLCSGKGRQELPGTPAEAVHPLRIFGGPRRDDGRGGGAKKGDENPALNSNLSISENACIKWTYF